MWHAAALCLLAACAGPAPEQPPGHTPVPAADLSPSSGGGVIGPAGGRLSVGPVSLEFPEGAVAAPVRIWVVPVGPGAPIEPGGLMVPEVPAPSAPVRVEPAELPLRRPLKISIATAREVSATAVARAGSFGTLPAVWLPLPGQGRAPSLVWAQSPYLGIFGLVQVDCCGESSGAACVLSCDVGPLRYRCDGTRGTGCCDAFARTPRLGEPLCGPGLDR